MNKLPEEMRELLEKLAGNKAFQACRGRYGAPVNSLFTEVAGNPSAFCREFDSTMASMRVMGNLLATLKRDGKVLAATELEQALTHEHVMLGETVPLEETAPMTLVVVEPERTFALMHWMLYDQLWFEMDQYIRHLDDGTNKPSQATLEIFKAFPPLEHAVRRRLKTNLTLEGEDVVEAFYDSVVMQFNIPESWGHVVPLYLAPNQTSDVFHWGYGSDSSHPVAYCVWKDQKTVLGGVERKNQERIGTWRINLPTLISDIDGRIIAFHEESEHQTQTAHDPTLVSRGCQFGMGARVFTRVFSSDFYGSDPPEIDGYGFPRYSDGTKDGKFRFALYAK